MLTVANVIGKQDDWAKYITNIEMLDTPFLDWLPVGNKPVNPIYDYQTDKFRAPRENAHVDGEPWTNFSSGGENRANLRAKIQWLDEGVSVSKLSQDVTDDAAIDDQLAYEIPKKLKEMSQDWEAAMCDDGESRTGNEVQGYKTRSVGNWVRATAQTDEPVDADFLTPTGSIVGTATASLTEAQVRGVLQSMWGQAKTVKSVTGFCGIDIKTKFADFQYYIPSSASTQSTGVVSNTVFKDKTISRAIDTYKGDGFMVDLVLTPWLAKLTGAASAIAGRAYFLHREMWEMRWNQKPKVYRPEFKGGSYEAAMDMIAMLVCKNPLGEGKLNPS